MKHLELSNVNGLDESIMNAVGMTDNLEYSSCCGADGDNYSNNVGEILTNVSTSLQSGDLGGKGTATGGGSGSTGGGKGAGISIDPEKLKQGVAIGTALLGKVREGRKTGETDIDAICGKRPLFGKKRKAEYQKCVDRVQKRKSDVTLKGQELELEKLRTQQQIESSRAEAMRGQGEKESGDKFLGMPKTVGITVAVVGGLALIVGGIFLVKKLRKG